VLRRRDEAQRSEAAPVVGLTRYLFENARVRTGVPRRADATALAVVGARIVAIGDRRTAARAAGPRAERIDCAGATILPGLIDPHLHLFALAARHAHLDCADAPDVDALLSELAAHATTLPSGVWLRAEGADDARLGRLPTAEELERAAPRNPVRLRHRSRHASVLSASALARLPPGIVHADGLVSGHEDVVGAAVGPLDAGEIAAGLARASHEARRVRHHDGCRRDAASLAALTPVRRAMDDSTFSAAAVRDASVERAAMARSRATPAGREDHGRGDAHRARSVAGGARATASARPRARGAGRSALRRAPRSSPRSTRSRRCPRGTGAGGAIVSSTSPSVRRAVVAHRGSWGSRW
jgi:hypothetical protein